jgi:PAS domain S-box-containing protein
VSKAAAIVEVAGWSREATPGDAESRLRDFLEISSDWVWETDAELRFTAVSGRLEELTGVAVAEVLGKTRREVMLDTESPAARRHLADLEARRPFRDFVYVASRPNGRRWSKISGKPVFDAAGRFQGYRGIGSDVTAEHEARGRADQLYASFAEALESVPASVILCDADERILLFNSVTRGFFPRVAHLLAPGVSFAEVLRAQAFSGFIPESVGREEEWLAERLRRFRNPEGTITRLYGDGRWVQIIERRTSDGGTIGVRVDVTDLKRHEEELATQSARLQATLDNISQGLGVFDSELRLAAFNGRFVELLGYPPGLAAIGRPFAELTRWTARNGEYGPEDPETYVASRLELVTRPEPHVVERRRPNGTVLEIAGRPMPGGGFVSTYTDITERKAAKDAIESHARELERSNAELEQFAYIASHDLQEPLRMVASYCQLLQRRYKGKLDADADEFIGFAVEGASRMQRMINELLNYSRVGRKSGPSSVVATGEIAAGAVASLKLAIEEAGATVEIGELPTVVGEKTLLHQLLQNLIGNAIKFRGETPVKVTVSAEREGAMWRFAVADTGIGIEKDYLERIFLIFQRLHERSKYPGTGIGLAVCKKVVEHHGGRIWVESEPGKGSTFFFTLPVLAEQGSAA